MRQHGDVTLGQEAALAMRFIRGDRYPDIPAAMSGAVPGVCSLAIIISCQALDRRCRVIDD